MELAQWENDGVIGEVMTHPATSPAITHNVLMTENYIGQTLMSIVGNNMERLPEAVALIIKQEHNSHKQDLELTECIQQNLKLSEKARNFEAETEMFKFTTD